MMLFRMVLTACKYIINKSLQVMSFKTMEKSAIRQTGIVQI